MKNVVITGAHGDIGFSIAERLAKEGWNLYLISKHRIEQDRIQQIERNHVTVVNEEFDISDWHKLELFFNTLRKRKIEIQALINNAGIYPIVSFEKYTKILWDSVIDINLSSSFRCVQYAYPLMKNSGGRIVNISSTGAHLGSRDPGYAASKAGLIGLTKSLAKSLAKYNILVNAIAPGMIDTKMSRRMGKEDRIKNVENSLVKRVGNVKDVSGAVHFLLSADASFITGATLDVNGGLYLR